MPSSSVGLVGSSGRADGVRWWRDAVPGVANGAVARREGGAGSRAGGEGAAGSLEESLLLRGGGKPAPAASSTCQQRYVS